MYTSVDPTTILQGDIVKEYNFIVPPTDELQVLKKNTDGSLELNPISQTENPYASGKASVIANSFLSDAIIISQSCDIQRRDYVHLCPVHKLENLVLELRNKNYENNRVENVLLDLKSEKINYYFYLPQGSVGEASIDESYIDLQFVGMIPLVNLASYNRFLTLTDRGRHRLSYKLINLYGRPF